ncbi:MAG: hypothetical protein AAFR61_26965 [Bacteroidota bacterium]
MSEHEQNLRSFQNLCIMALSDGVLHEDERTLLKEVAISMGLEEAEGEEIMSKAVRLEFWIPETEEQRQMELRMAVLMMITDGQIDGREYSLCKKMAEAMGIEEEYLEQITQLYVEKQQEKIYHLSLFQNLYLIAIADGQITEEEEELLIEIAYNLGLSQEDIEYIAGHTGELELIIPEEEQERFYSLKNLIYMMIVDGEIDQEEYALCLEFAEASGMGEAEIKVILQEYEEDQQEQQAQGDTAENIDIYLDVFQAFKKIPLTVKELAEEMEYAFNFQNFEKEISADQAHNRAFYDLMWLAMVRGTKLLPDMWAMLPIHLDLVRKQQNFKVLWDYLIRTEQELGKTAIELPELSLQEIRADLGQLFH